MVKSPYIELMVQSEKPWETITPRQQAILVFVGANPLAIPLAVTELTTKSQLGSSAVIHKAMLKRQNPHHC